MGPSTFIMTSLQPTVWRLSGTHRKWPSAAGHLQLAVPRLAAQRRAQRLAKRFHHGKPAAPRLAAQRHAQRLAKRCMACAACSPTSGGTTARAEGGQALSSWQACSPTSGGATACAEGGQALLSWQACSPVWRRNGTHRGWPSAAWHVQLAAPRLAAQRHAQRLAKRFYHGKLAAPRLAAQQRTQRLAKRSMAHVSLQPHVWRRNGTLRGWPSARTIVRKCTAINTPLTCRHGKTGTSGRMPVPAKLGHLAHASCRWCGMPAIVLR